jgi:hypothetical protein
MWKLIKSFSVVSVVVTASVLISSGSVDAARQKLTYKWSDGRAVAVKDIPESKYGDYENTPSIEVTLPDPTVPRRIRLEYQYKGKWRVEDAETTVDGFASLDVYPYYDDDTWLTGTWNYRIVVLPTEGQPKFKTVRFKAKFTPMKRSSSGGGSGGGSSGGGSGSFVGWNLEDVQDYLRYDPSTRDCSGGGRSVFWS